MANKIGWCDKTWSPTTGCTPISEACDHCWAKRMSARLAGRYGYPADEPFRVTLHPDKLGEPFKWKKPQRIFVVSMGDLFHLDIPDSEIDKVFAVMALTAQHQFQVLTKRPERMLAYMTSRPADDIYSEMVVLTSDPESCWVSSIRSEWPLPNVSLGVTAENQERADERIPVLLQTPAAVRFVSVEPMLGPVDPTKYLYNCQECGGSGWLTDGRGSGEPCGCMAYPALSWVICGGETGPGARPMRPEWVRSLRDQCQEAGVPFWFKGWGASYDLYGPMVAHRQPEGQTLDGQLWHERPEGK